MCIYILMYTSYEATDMAYICICALYGMRDSRAMYMYNMYIQVNVMYI